MAKAVFHLLPRPVGYEVLCVCDLSAVSVDRPCWGLGPSMDGKQRDGAGLLRHAFLPGRDERYSILHHR